MKIVYPIAAFVTSFLVSLLLYKYFIPKLRKVKLGQKILEVGPNWHKCKEGTPTMGGLFFIFAMFVSVLVMWALGVFKNMGIFFPINICFVFFNAAIGFIDDYVKLFKKRNKGLTASQKMTLQILVTVAYLVALKASNCIDTTLSIPFTSDYVNIGIFYYIIIGIAIVYIVNTANLTDGLDGLAGSIAFVISVLFILIGAREGWTDMYVSESALCGALLGFLVFNIHPAKIFMGDTGSLFLGAMLVSCVMRIGRPWLMFLIGIIYVIEGVSVMLQVGYFKLTHGKRLFKMAPIHHHFELCEYSEVQIVAMFLSVTVLASVLAYYIYIIL